MFGVLLYRVSHQDYMYTNVCSVSFLSVDLSFYFWLWCQPSPAEPTEHFAPYRQAAPVPQNLEVWADPQGRSPPNAGECVVLSPREDLGRLWPASFCPGLLGPRASPTPCLRQPVEPGLYPAVRCGLFPVGSPLGHFHFPVPWAGGRGV